MASLTNKQIFPGLHPEHFQHPLDISTTEALKRVPLLPMFISWLNSKSLEHLMRQRNLESTIRLSQHQGGSIYEAFEYACHILDIEQPPELFIKNQPYFNAYAMGTKRHSIVLTSSLVDAVNEEELLAVIGHELGHIKCEHMLYKTVSHVLALFGLEIIRDMVPGVGQAAGMAIGFAMTNWSRKAELSCDRASLLVAQDVQIVSQLTMLLAAGSRKIIPELNVNEVFKQAEELEEMENTLLGKLFQLQDLQNTHPVPIQRCVEIDKWSKSTQYQDILSGAYAQVNG